MSPAVSPLCSFHEKRINDLNDDVNKLTTVQATIDTKLDALTTQVHDSGEEITGKLDRILDQFKTVDTRIEVLEKKDADAEQFKGTVKKYALRLALPATLVVIGLLTGTQGDAIWKAVTALVGGK